MNYDSRPGMRQHYEGEKESGECEGFIKGARTIMGLEIRKSAYAAKGTF